MRASVKNVVAITILYLIIKVFHLVMYNIKADHFYMSLCPYANVLIQFLRIYRLSSKHDKDILLIS